MQPRKVSFLYDCSSDAPQSAPTQVDRMWTGELLLARPKKERRERRYAGRNGIQTDAQFEHRSCYFLAVCDMPPIVTTATKAATKM